MPVVDGVLVPRTPLVEAEHVVDYLGHHDHIEQRRATVERAGQAETRRAALTITMLGLPSPTHRARIASRLETALGATARHGYRSARQEIRMLRAGPIRGELVFRDTGTHPDVVTEGLDGVLWHVRRRAIETATAILAAAVGALGIEDDPDLQRLAVSQAAARTLHNAALELVGETLNLGRAAGAMSLAQPPEFAMRSEQLDKATCDACTRLHGEIVEVGSSSYYEYMPPAGCYGGGRCRGIYVYSDLREQTRGPAPERMGPQPALNPVPPVEIPRRRQAA